GVTDDSGFEIPVPINKITHVHGDMRREDDIEPTRSSNDIPSPFVEPGIYVGITGHPRAGLPNFYFINHTSYDILIAASEINSTKRIGVFAEKILARDSVQFYSSNFGNVSKWPNFEIQILRFSNTAHIATDILSTAFKVRPMDLHAQKET